MSQKQPTQLAADEYAAKLKAYIADHGGPQGSGFFGSWAHHVIMEKRFQAETGYVPAPGPPSSARPGSFSEYVKKTEQGPKRGRSSN